MIRAVLFDLGGTLHTSDKPAGRDVWFAKRILDRLEDYGIHLPAEPAELAAKFAVTGEVYKHHSEETLRESPGAVIWSEFYLDGYGLTREQLEPMAEELSFLYDYERVRNMRRPALVETMQSLRDMGLQLGIISNIISTSVVPHFLREYGLYDMMDCVITSSQVGVRKPSADIFRVAEQQLGLKPEELAYVGDTLSRDVRGVRNAGWKLMIQIRNPSIAHRDAGIDPNVVKPDYLIDDLAEIPAIIRKENGQPGADDTN